MTPELFDGMVAVPCAVMMNPANPQNGWLFIPHADDKWVSAVKLESISGRIIEHWLREHAPESRVAALRSDGPAFPAAFSNDTREPVTGWCGESVPPGKKAEYMGVSMRDYFAAKAMPMAWAAEEQRPTGPYREHMEPTYAGIASRAYHLADAMLKARQA